jgi:hypothetical protein
VEVHAGTTPTAASVTYGVITGGISVVVTGAPPGSSPTITIGNNAGYSRTLIGSGEVGNLTPGVYEIASVEIDAGEIYATTPRNTSITVTASVVPVPVTMSYAAITGSIQFTSTGLPAGASASWEITGPGGFARIHNSVAALSKLAPGQYTVSPRNVSHQGDTYGPTSGAQTVAVNAGQTSAITTPYLLRPPTLNLTVVGMYLTQATQTFSGTVPLVSGRDAYLRVFVRANESNSASPSVRVRFYRGGQLLSTQSVSPPRSSVPTVTSEQSTADAWSAVISGTVLQPGTAILVDVDPDNTTRETSDADNQFPQTGTPRQLDIRSVPAASFRFVPIATGDGLVGDVTPSRVPALLTYTLRMFPLLDVNADVRGVYSTSRVLAASDSNRAWSGILSELDAIRIAEGSGRQHIGILKDNGSGSGIAGLAYVPGRSSLSIDVSYAPETIAHEVGHNWGRRHAPCGGPGLVDQSFPYIGGIIGVYGYDPSTGALLPPTVPDLMSYCRLPLPFSQSMPRQWISDYTYAHAMNHRSTFAMAASQLAPTDCLIVWGRSSSQGIVLEPAFIVKTIPHLPDGGGTFRLTARNENGVSMLTLDFEPLTVTDGRTAEKQFAYAIPVSHLPRATVASLTVSNGSLVTESRRVAIGRGMAEITAKSGGENSVRLQWDVRKLPLLVVRDPANGEILALARTGNDIVRTRSANLDVIASDGVRSQQMQLQVRQ